MSTIGIDLARKLYGHNPTKMEYYFDLFEKPRTVPFLVKNNKTGIHYMCYLNGLYFPLITDAHISDSELVHKFVKNQESIMCTVAQHDDDYFVRVLQFDFYKFVTEFSIVDEGEVPKARIKKSFYENTYIIETDIESLCAILSTKTATRYAETYNTRCVWFDSFGIKSLEQILDKVVSEYDRIALANRMMNGLEPSVFYDIETEKKISMALKIGDKKLGSIKEKHVKFILPYKQPISVRIATT